MMSVISVLKGILGRPDRGRHISIPSTMAFHEVDFDETRRQLDIAVEAERRGSQNLPAATSDGLDDVEQNIVARIDAEKNFSLNRYLDNQTTYSNRINALGFDNTLSEILNTTTSACADFTARVHDGKNWLFQARRKVIEIEEELQAFRKTHRISWMSRHPKSSVLYVAFLLLLLLAESVGNGMLLARGSEYGLLGGVGTALLIAAVNIGVGVFVGLRFATQVTHRVWVRKIAGFCAIVAFLGFTFAFNLAVAHYRVALGGPTPEDADQLAIQNLLAHPFDIDELVSWLLFVLGLLFSILAAMDGWLMDEPYPGYGKLTRRHEELLDEYAEQVKLLMDELEEIKRTAERKIESCARDINLRQSEYHNILNRSEALQRAFDSHLVHLENAANSLLRFYRAENQRHRTTPPPPTFGAYWTLDRPSVGGSSVSAKSIEERINRTLSRADREVPRCLQDLLAAYQRAIAEYKRIEQLTEPELESV